MLAVITGSSKGIGFSIAKKFAAKGFDLVLNARNEKDLIAAKNDILRVNPNINIVAIAADISITSERKRFENEVLAMKTPISVLVNNAGLYLTGSLLDEDEDNLEAMLQTNVVSAYKICRAFLPNMIATQKGHIFNICSVASIRTFANTGSYSVSKYALLGFTRALREELKEEKVKVTAVLPGATFTDSWKGVEIDYQRIINSDDIAEMIYSAYKLSASTTVEEILVRPTLGDL